MTDIPSLEGVTHRTVTVGGLNFHVAEAGQGDGKPIVLLHGWPQHWYCWHKIIPTLAPHYRLIMPDLRGLGWSDAPRMGYTKTQLAQDVIGVMDALGLEKTYLVGHDWGGWTGFLLCIQQPARFQKYICFNSPHPFQKLDWPRIRHLWRFWYQVVIAMPLLGKKLIQSGRMTRLIFQQNIEGGMAVWSPEVVNLYVDRLRDAARAYASVLYYRTFVFKEFAPVAFGKYPKSRLTVPTRIIFGTSDAALSTVFLRGYEPYADDLQVELLDGVGHFSPEEAPDIAAARILEFFKG